MLGTALSQTLADLKPVALDKEDIDITDARSLSAKMIEVAPQVIINAAAYTNVDGAESNHDAAFAVNETGVKNIVRAARDLNAIVLHYSTDYVFPGDREEGYSEFDTPGPPVNAYGASKLAGEVALQTLHPRHYLLRTAWLYGPHGKNFVDTILRLAHERPRLQVVNDQEGSPTFTFDVAQATRTILEKQYTFGTYHVVNTGHTTWYKFAEAILTLAGIKTSLEPVTSSQYQLPAARPKYSMLKNIQGPRLRPWEAALDDYLKNYYTS